MVNGSQKKSKSGKKCQKPSKNASLFQKRFDIFYVSFGLEILQGHIFDQREDEKFSIV